MARPRQVSDEAILQVARQCFLEHGPSVSTHRIAEAVGVSQGVLFKRFGTKEELMVRALAPPGVPPFVALVESGPDPRSLPVQLQEIGQAILTFARSMTPCLSILRASGMDPVTLLARYDVPPPVLGHRVLSGWFRRAMEAGRIRALDPDATALLLMGSMQARAFSQHLLGMPMSDVDAQRYVEEVVGVLWQGVRPVEEL